MALNEDIPASPRERTTLYERLRRAPLVRRVLAVPVVQRILLPARGDSSTHKFIRYSMVSAVAIVISQVTILICAWVFGLSGIAANTIGALTATPASYELNRKWAWGKHGKSHLWREVVPFWALTLVGFLGSTGMVELADNAAKSHGITGLLRALLIMGASLFAYGVVWIVKFMLFNRVIFVDRSAEEDVAAPSTVAPSTAPTPSTAAAPSTVPAQLVNGSSPPRPVLEGQGTIGL
jgi:putative flippase GtrA